MGVAWLHPALGILTLTLLCRVASLGLTARSGAVRAGGARARHRVLAPVAYGLVVANVVFGFATVWGVRTDLDLAASRHAWVGCALLAVLTVGAVLSRRVPTDPVARRWHPWCGAVALMLGGVQLFLGLQLVRW